MSDKSIKIRILMPWGFYELNVHGQDGDYFVINEKGHVWWLDDMANDGIQWEFVK
ncbi:hypothetical protein J7S95_12370 [Providencia stuartii]|uniref:hypothetical protein n=1 Tax=Morganellaceae TaxID=1903414 RepID=UPI001B39C0B4|nr:MULTISPECIES: hypothetical protein [Morganellaceae]MBQ0314776.1 hypothetical protein [Providencia rettgeri]MBQ0322090.1 hypothetical protein [Providencia rettgeri]MBQ0348657.1 hypothetical protein [Providencia rettgeri]MBQ0404771.1 hypothetical protein [Providencia rettgeri]MBQ0457509.1 hypothetical protein [Providencia stuartii]